jgi:hypothetical protein
MPITCRIAATALLALAIGGSTVAQAAEHDVARTGLGDMTVTRQDVPRVARTGLGDMTVTRRDVRRVTRTGPGHMTTGATQPAASQTPDRIPWRLITASALLAATAAFLHNRTRRRRSAVAR